MTKRLPVAPTPSPLEEYSQHFEELFSLRNQREGFRRLSLFMVIFQAEGGFVHGNLPPLMTRIRPYVLLVSRRCIWAGGVWEWPTSRRYWFTGMQESASAG